MKILESEEQLTPTPAPPPSRGRGRARLCTTLLNRTARAIASLIITAAGAKSAPCAKSNHRHGRLKTRGFRRALIGARLRKALRDRDPYQRLGKIACALRDIDAHAAQLARRLRHGLSRRRLVRIYFNDPAPRAAQLARAAFNTS